MPPPSLAVLPTMTSLVKVTVAKVAMATPLPAPAEFPLIEVPVIVAQPRRSVITPLGWRKLEGSSADLCEARALVALDRRFRPLDGIRALAVLAVLATHAGIPFLPGGFVGVDVFFVLSGFLITSLLYDESVVTGRIALGEFWTRRARRLLPAALVMIVAVVAARPLFVPDSVAALRGDAIAASLWSGNWRWALQGTDYFAQGGTPSPLQHTWSLAVEEQFYLVWPLLLLACRAVRRRRLLALSLAGVAVSALATYVLARVASPGRVYFGTDTRAQELLVGAALAALLAPTWRWRAAAPLSMRSPQAAARRPLPLLLSVCGLAALTGVATAADGAPSEFRHGLLLLTALAAAALVAGVVLDSGHLVARLLSTRLLVGIGRISYGLYSGTGRFTSPSTANAAACTATCSPRCASGSPACSPVLRSC